MPSLRSLLTLAAALALAPDASAAQPAGAPILIENRTGFSIYNLYVAAEGRRGWGPDRLDDATIPAGRSRTVSLDPGPRRCRHKVKLVLADRREVVRGIDLCRGGRWTIEPGGDRLAPGSAR